MRKNLFLLTLLIISLLMLPGCKEKAEKGTNEITSFTYTFGSFNSGSYQYKIQSKNNKILFSVDAFDPKKGNINTNKEINNNQIYELNKIINENNIEKWNNFNKRDDNILDGYSFSINIKYKNGKKISASGYMKYPKNYNKAHNELKKFLESLY